GLVAMGTVMEAVPVTGLAPNFSPRPRIAPPPFGKETEDARKGAALAVACWVPSVWLRRSTIAPYPGFAELPPPLPGKSNLVSADAWRRLPSIVWFGTSELRSPLARAYRGGRAHGKKAGARVTSSALLGEQTEDHCSCLDNGYR